MSWQTRDVPPVILFPSPGCRLPVIIYRRWSANMETVRNIQNPIPPALLKPSKWLSVYEDFVTKNASSVGQVESALRSLTYIIPGERHRLLWIPGK